MRVISIFLWVFSAAFAALWAYAYAYVGAMACGFSANDGRNCTIKMPWQHSGEDLTLLVLVPGAIFAVLVIVAVIVGRVASRRGQSQSQL